MADYITYNLLVDGQERELKITDVLDTDIKQLCFELVEREQDVVIVFDGEEGSGKSHGLRQIGWVFNHHLKTMFGVVNDFSSQNIHYKVTEYLQSMWGHETKLGWINALDEGGDEVDKQSTTSAEGKRFTRSLRRARKLGHIHLIAMPAAHDLNKYIALWRMKFIIKFEKRRVKSDKSPTGRDLLLGNFRVIRNDNRWKYCYMDKTPYKYPKFLHNNKLEKNKDGEMIKYNKDHNGRFEYCEVFSKHELDALREKNLAFAKELDLAEPKGRSANQKKYEVLHYKIKHPELSYKEIAEATGCNPKYAQQVLNRAG